MTVWPLKKFQAPTSVREATRVHSVKSVSLSHTHWGCKIEWDWRSLENNSSSAFAKNTLEMVWLKQLLMWVSFICSSSLSFIAMTLKTGAWSDLFCHSPACIDIFLCSGHVFVDYSSIIIPTVSSDLLYLLHHHWFERPPFCERGFLVRNIWIYSN